MATPDPIFSKEQGRSVLLMILILLPGLLLASYCDTFRRYFLCLPSAQISSLFLGSNCTATAEGYLLTNPILTVHVTKVCSAMSFFILLSTLAAGAVIRSLRPKEFLNLIWIIPLAYVITILANAARIIAGWVTGRWARAVLPENFWPGVHLGTGVVVFLTFLIITYLLLKWRLLNGHQGSKTAHY